MTIKRALLSVSDKTDIVDLAKFLSESGVEILSTGGTAKALREAGIEVHDVSAITNFPEIMDGRVKTLHPNIHGGILADRDKIQHLKALEEHQIPAIDLVVLNLYPFEQTLRGGGSYGECVEQIDIGGPAMLRASAKNHAHVTIITNPADYTQLIAEMRENHGSTTLDFRKIMAQKAFALTSHYDAVISRWLWAEQNDADSVQFPEHFSYSGALKTTLRYGENPHQHAALYVDQPQGNSLAHAKQWQGKELSYNNLNDTQAAWALAQEFTEPSVAIIKHANPCGIAVAEGGIVEAFHKALACDPVSAYGGIIALNRPLTRAFVEAMGKLFVEVIVAPEVEEDAAALLAQKKKNLRLLEIGSNRAAQPDWDIRPVSGGFLLQQADHKTVAPSDLSIVSALQPSKAQRDDMLFAFKVCKHVKSNAIILVKDGATIGIGAGQMSRVDSVFVACRKAKEAGLDVAGSTMASDAFFPFDDNIHLAAEAGVKAIIHPGGSIRDEEVIAAADKHGMAMATTGFRHFRH